MPNTPPFDLVTASQLASSPEVDPMTLYQIAQHYPQLHSIIAANPQVYPDLLKWMSSQGVAEATRQLQLRQVNTGATTVVSATALSVDTPAETPAKKKTSNAGLIALLIVLVLILLTLIGLIIAMLAGGAEANPAASNGQSVEIAAQDDATKKAVENGKRKKNRDEEGKKTEQEKEDKKSSTEQRYPVPAGTPDISPVAAPSKNIFCELHEDRIVCTIYENYFSDTDLPNCGKNRPVTFEVTETATTMSCTPLPKNGTELPYDHYTSRGDSACRVTTEGMNCWNKKSGQSVFFARNTWSKGNSGPR